MKLGMNLEQHLHACMNALSGGSFKVRLDEHPSVSPAGGMRLGYRRIGAFVLFDELQITMPTVALTSLREFRFHPIAIGQGHRNDVSDYRIQFI